MKRTLTLRHSSSAKEVMGASSDVCEGECNIAEGRETGSTVHNKTEQVLSDLPNDGTELQNATAMPTVVSRHTSIEGK
jgi:hypothetical protein